MSLFPFSLYIRFPFFESREKGKRVTTLVGNARDGVGVSRMVYLFVDAEGRETAIASNLGLVTVKEMVKTANSNLVFVGVFPTDDCTL